MTNFKWSESFISIEGEAKYSGRPTVYLRFFGCNFECRGFNNPDNVNPVDPEVLGFDPKLIKTVAEIPVPISVGCDSVYSVHRDFIHMSKNGTEDDVVNELVSLLPKGKSWSDGFSLSLTGGEPTLRQKNLHLILSHPLMKDLSHIILETNCAVPIRDSFVDYMNEWAASHNGVLTWSNSPKLSVSGEKWDKAIRPDIAIRQNLVQNSDQYFKFVCDETDESFDEVERAMREYHEVGIEVSPSNIYIMPVACTEAQQRNIAQLVADKCIQRGWVYCHRIHNTVYENAIGK